MLLTTPLGERETLKQVPEMLPMMDAEVERLGRSASARVVALEDEPQSTTAQRRPA